MLNGTENENGEVIDSALVVLELRRVLDSPQFRASLRSKQFLCYVIEEKEAGRAHLIKERSIGIDVFSRSADYNTSEDSVVRVQANEVRRRLAMFYASTSEQSSVMIELPAGSYVPRFRIQAPVPAIDDPIAPKPLPEEESRHSPSELMSEAPASVDVCQDGKNLQVSDRKAAFPWQGGIPKLLTILAFSVGIIGVYKLVRFIDVKHATASDQFSKFWDPLQRSRQPVLLCLPRPVVYRATPALFDRYDRDYSPLFTNKVDRETQAIPFRPDETVRWSDLRPTSSGPAVGGTLASINLAVMLTEHHHAFIVRFGNEASVSDLRGAATISIGALNSHSLTALTTDPHFSFIDVNGEMQIRENEQHGRSWKMERDQSGAILRDYAVITRQTTSRAGQFFVSVAGISDSGTQAASEIVTSTTRLPELIRGCSSDWDRRNMQLVIATDKIDGRSGPSGVVGCAVW